MLDDSLLVLHEDHLQCLLSFFSKNNTIFFYDSFDSDESTR